MLNYINWVSNNVPSQTQQVDLLMVNRDFMLQGRLPLAMEFPSELNDSKVSLCKEQPNTCKENKKNTSFFFLAHGWMMEFSGASPHVLSSGANSFTKCIFFCNVDSLFALVNQPQLVKSSLVGQFPFRSLLKGPWHSCPIGVYLEKLCEQFEQL